MTSRNIQECRYCGVFIKPHPSVEFLWTPTRRGYRSPMCFTAGDAEVLHQPLEDVNV